MENFSVRAIDLFISTAIERHTIYVKRQKGESRPWTEDPIFHKYFFCNVFRQLDKCSLWMIANVIHPHRGSILDLLDIIVTFRYISSYEIYLALGERIAIGEYTPENVRQSLREFKQSGTLKYNGCFLRNPRANGGAYSIVDIPLIIAKWLRQHNQEVSSSINQATFESLTKFLINAPATGGFMAHQYCCDLSYSSLWDPTDALTYATMGPGSKQGMNILLDRPRNASMGQAEWLRCARELWVVMSLRLERQFGTDLIVTLQEVQNWLCEFQKYVKYKAMEKGHGRVKARKYS